MAGDQIISKPSRRNVIVVGVVVVVLALMSLGIVFVTSTNSATTERQVLPIEEEETQPSSSLPVFNESVVATVTPNSSTFDARTPSPTYVPWNVPTSRLKRVPTNSPSPNPSNVPITLLPTKIPVLNPTAFPTQVPVLPTLVPAPVPIPVPIVIPTPVPIPVPVPIPIPVPVPIPIPVPVPIPAPIPVPVSIPTPLPVTLMASPPIGYNLQLDVTGVPDEDKWFFTSAAQRWNDVIRTGVTQTSTLGFGPPPLTGCIFPAVIDDLYICGGYEKIDGSYNVLGYSGIDYTTVVNGIVFPTVGKIGFDLDDVTELKNRGTYDRVILHELGHNIGIGSLWLQNNLINSTTSCETYYGTEGNRVYNLLSGCINATKTMPIEQGGGAGTECAHLSNECFQEEIMTGFYDRNSPSPLSAVTIAMLHDLGHPQVDYSKADPFVSSDLGLSCRCNARKTRSRSLESSTSLLPSLSNDNNHSSRHRRRQLSDVGKQRAMNFGTALLQRHQKRYDEQQRKLSATNETIMINENVKFVGGEMVIILYLEEDQIHGVTVTKDDIP